MRAGVWAPRGRRAAAYLCFALAVTLGGAARGGPHPALQRQLQLGQYRLVHRAVLPLLTASPDDPDLMAMLGAALAKAGCAGDAEAAFRLAEGSPWAEAEALPLRADALRTLGAVAQAGALRRAALLDGDRHAGWEAQVWMEIAEDHIEQGDLVEAEAMMQQAIAWYPAAALPWAGLARVAQLRGDPEARDEAMWMAERLADRPLGLLDLVRAAVLAEEGAHEAADALLRAQPTARGNDVRLWALRAQIARQRGAPDEALRLLHEERFNWSEEPLLTEERVRALWALDQHDAADAVLAQARRRLPGSGRLADLAVEAELRALLRAGRPDAAAARWAAAVAEAPRSARRAALGRWASAPGPALPAP
jgi:tetratricopeptide (TPR) repeat protein